MHRTTNQQVLVPMAKSVKSVGKQLRLVEQPLHRGYVFVQMAMDRDLYEAVLAPNGTVPSSSHRSPTSMSSHRRPLGQTSPPSSNQTHLHRHHSPGVGCFIGRRVPGKGIIPNPLRAKEADRLKVRPLNSSQPHTTHTHLETTNTHARPFSHALSS